MPSIRRGRGSINYDRFGNSDSNRTVVIIPGMGMSAPDYRSLAELLSESSLVITVNHRDISPSTARAALNHSIKAASEDVAAIVDAESRCNVIALGESYGGMVAMGLALYHSKLISRIALVNTSIGGIGQMRLRPMSIARLLRGSIRGQSFYRSVSSNLFSSDTIVNRRDFVEDWIAARSHTRYPHSAVRKQLVAAASFTPSRELGLIKCPVDIIYGGDDRLVSPTNSFEIHQRIAQSTLHRIQQAGHHICGEYPEQLAEKLSIGGNRTPSKQPA